MSLISVGRNTVVAAELRREHGRPPTDRSSDLAAEQEAERARQKALLDTLTPWIPGDFAVTYAALLTTWANLRGNFPWLVVIAIVSAVAFVFGGAFATTGFLGTDGATWRRLTVRTVIGAAVSVYAAAAIPNSGWRDFEWFTNNESSWIITATLVATGIVLVLRGFKKRGLLD
jgi:hypothetical protein